MTRRLPWADILGWTALVLAGVAAVGVGLGLSAAIDGARWGRASDNSVLRPPACP